MNKKQEEKKGGTYIAPTHLMRKEKEQLDRDGRVVKRTIDEPKKK